MARSLAHIRSRSVPLNSPTNSTDSGMPPKKYSDAGSSGLTLTIDGPTDAAKIQLTWEGGHPFAEAIEGGGQ